MTPDSSQPRRRRVRETPLELATRIGDAYGLVLLLIVVTFAVMMTLPPEGWAGRLAAVVIAGITAIVAFTTSDVRPARVRLAILTVFLAAIATILAKLIPSNPLLGAAFLADAVLLAIAAVTILRRVIVGAHAVDYRTILGAISVYTLFGLLFSFLYFAVGRWSSGPFFTAGSHASAANDYLFFSYVSLTTTGYGNLIPAGTVGQSLAVLEMLVGQVFLVTLVAGLVSLWRPGRKAAAADGAEP